MSPELIGLVATVVFLARLLPQPVKLVRTGVAAGVSPLGAWNGVVTDVAWLVYGLAVGLVPVWGVAAAGLLPATWTAWLLRRHLSRPQQLGVAAWLAVVVAAGVTGHLVWVLGLSVLVNHGPAAWEAVRDDDLSGIAVSTWVIALFDAALWGWYGALVGDPALLGYAVVLTSCALIVLGRVAWFRAGAEDEGTLVRLDDQFA